MTFGEKLRKLRKDADMTQEELAARLYVTRAAVSKWETDKGYPAIDSLKLIAELFGCTIDELVSDADVENQKKLESDRAKIMYVCAIACFAVAVAFALVAYFLSDMRWTIGAFVGIAGYLVFAFSPVRAISGSRGTGSTAPSSLSSCSSSRRRSRSRGWSPDCGGIFVNLPFSLLEGLFFVKKRHLRILKSDSRAPAHCPRIAICYK